MLLKEWLYTKLFWRHLLMQVALASWYPIARLVSPGQTKDYADTAQASLGISLSMVCIFVIGERMRFESPPGPGLLMLKASGGSRRVVPAKWLFDTPLLLIAMLPPVLLTSARYDLLGLFDTIVVLLLGAYLATVGYVLGALSRLPIGVLVLMMIGIGSSVAMASLGEGHTGLLQDLCWVPMLGVYAEISLIIAHEGAYLPPLVWMAVQGVGLLSLSSLGLQRLLTRQLR